MICIKKKSIRPYRVNLASLVRQKIPVKFLGPYSKLNNFDQFQ